MKIYLVRHGQTDENLNSVVQGWLDVELNKTGHEQARQVAERFEHEVDLIISSDLKRALQTAEYFKDQLNLQHFKDWRLRERNFGEAQGTKGDIHDWEQFWLHKDKATIKGAETLNQFNHRINDFIKTLKSDHFNYEKVLIVTHGGTINRFRDLVENKDFKQFNNLEMYQIEL